MSKLLTMTLLTAALLGASGGVAKSDDEGDLSPLALFDQRIMPIFKSPRPSSCVQCHLASVDLKNYILPSHEKTFVSLRDQGLINLDHPEKSKILTLIRMGNKDLDKGARLIHEKTRKAEYAAFAAWIKACCSDPQLRNLPKLDSGEQAKPSRANPVIRHARKSRVVDSFVRNIWSQKMRCFPCHTPHEIDPSNPKHKVAIKKQKEFKQKYGERMEIFRETPEATLDYLIKASRKPSQNAYPLINLKEPRNSLLVLKPTAKLPKRGPDKQFEQPSSSDPVTHMGGLKMHRDDQSYKSFIAWIQDYANVVGDRYTRVEQLPADNWYPTNLVLKVFGTPKSWSAGTPVQLFVHAWDQQQGTWKEDPLAFTQGTVTPRGRVMGALFLLPAKNAAGRLSAANLKTVTPRPGRFLIKAYLDAQHRLDKDPAVLLGEEDFASQAVIQVEQWREGFRFGTVVPGERFTKR